MLNLYIIIPHCPTCLSRSSANKLSTCEIPLLYFLNTDSSSSSPSPTAIAAICARLSRSSVSSPGCCEVSKQSKHVTDGTCQFVRRNNCNLSQSFPVLAILVPFWSVTTFLVFFYLRKLRVCFFLPPNRNVLAHHKNTKLPTF